MHISIRPFWFDIHLIIIMILFWWFFLVCFWFFRVFCDCFSYVSFLSGVNRKERSMEWRCHTQDRSGSRSMNIVASWRRATTSPSRYLRELILIDGLTQVRDINRGRATNIRAEANNQLRRWLNHFFLLFFMFCFTGGNCCCCCCCCCAEK